jgi:predicted thioesterase
VLSEEQDGYFILGTKAATGALRRTSMELTRALADLRTTPVGRLISGEAEVTKVDGRQIEFAVQAAEGPKEIGAGSHSRVVIDVAKFVRRLE